LDLPLRLEEAWAAFSADAKYRNFPCNNTVVFGDFNMQVRIWWWWVGVCVAGWMYCFGGVGLLLVLP
jgi:hypothetical protein